MTDPHAPEAHPAPVAAPHTDHATPHVTTDVDQRVVVRDGTGGEIQSNSPLTSEPARVGHFDARSESGPAGEVQLKAEDEDKILDILYMKAQAVKDAGAAPDDVIFGTRALQKYEERKAWRKRYKDSPASAGKEPAGLTRSEIAAAYYEILAEIKLELQVIGYEATAGKEGPIFKRRAIDVFEDAGTDTYLANSLRRREFHKLSREAQLKEIQSQNELRRTIFHRITGRDMHAQEFQQWTDISNNGLMLGEGQGGNYMHQAIREAVFGRTTDIRSGILGREKYKQYWGTNRTWEELTPEEREDVWRRVAQAEPSEQNRIVYEAIERGAGTFCEDMGKQIQLELGGRLNTEDARHRIHHQLEHHREHSKDHVVSHQKTADSILTALEAQQKVLEDEVARYDAGVDQPESIAHWERELEDRKAKYAQYVGTSTHPGYKAKQIEDLNTQITRLQTEIRRRHTDLNTAVASGIHKDVTSAYARSLDLAQLDRDINEKETLRRQLEKEVAEVKEQKRQAERELKQRKARKAAIIAQLNDDPTRVDSAGNPDPDGLRKKVKNAKDEASRLKSNLAIVESAEITKLSHDDREGHALLRMHYLTESASYNRMMEAHFSRDLREYSDPTYGIDNFRKAVLDNHTHSEIAHDPILNQLMISELDYVKIMVRALRLTDIDVATLDTDANRGLINTFNVELKKPHDLSHPSTALSAAQAAVEGIPGLRDAQRKILSELARRNRWEVSNALRIAVSDLREKAIAGHPFAQEPAQHLPKSEQTKRKLSEEKIPPEVYARLEQPQRFDTSRRSNELFGCESIVTSLSIPNGPHRGDYFIVIRSRETNPGPPPTFEPYHEVWDEHGTSYGEISNEALTDGRVGQEAGKLREDLLIHLAMKSLNDHIDQSGTSREYDYNDGTVTRKIRREEGSNRLYISDGIEKTARPSDVIYLDEEIVRSTDLRTALTSFGNTRIETLLTRLEDYMSTTRNEIGTARVTFRPGYHTAEWHNENTPNHNIRLTWTDIGGLWTYNSRLRVAVHAALLDPVAGPLTTTDFGSVDSLHTELAAHLPPDILRNFYAGFFQHFMDSSRARRREFINGIAAGGTFNRLESSVIPDFGQVEVYENNGDLVVKRVQEHSGGVTRSLSPEEQEDIILEDFLNNILQEQPNGTYQNILKEIEALVGKEYLRLVDMIQRPQY